MISPTTPMISLQTAGEPETSKLDLLPDRTAVLEEFVDELLIHNDDARSARVVGFSEGAAAEHRNIEHMPKKAGVTTTCAVVRNSLGRASG